MSCWPQPPARTHSHGRYLKLFAVKFNFNARLFPCVWPFYCHGVAGLVVCVSAGDGLALCLAVLASMAQTFVSSCWSSSCRFSCLSLFFLPLASLLWVRFIFFDFAAKLRMRMQQTAFLLWPFAIVPPMCCQFGGRPLLQLLPAHMRAFIASFPATPALLNAVATRFLRLCNVALLHFKLPA